MNSGWMEILNKVQNGEISAQEGAELLQKLEASGIGPAGSLPEPESTVPSAAESEPAGEEEPEVVVEVGDAKRFSAEPEEEKARLDDDIKRLNAWRNWWLAPFGAGLAIFLLSAVLMAWGYTNERFFWFYCAWLPLLLGLLVLVLGAWSRQARWLHLRVNEPAGSKGDGAQRVAISMPLPTRLAGWLLRLFGPRIPQYKEQNLESMIPMLQTLSDTNEPLIVEVNETDGKSVQIYIL